MGARYSPASRPRSARPRHPRIIKPQSLWRRSQFPTPDYPNRRRLGSRPTFGALCRATDWQPTVLTCTRTCCTRRFFGQEDRAKEKDHEVQNDGSGGVGCGVCCGHGGGDGAGCWHGRGEDEDAGGSGAAAGYRAEGHQPECDGRGHRFAAERSTGDENASDWGVYVAVGYRGAEILANLYPLREGLVG